MKPISFSITKDDALALACHYYAKSPTVRRNRIKSQVVVFVIMVGIGFLTLKGMGHAIDVANVMFVFLVMGVAVLIGYNPSWHRVALRRSAERMLEESAYAKAFGNCTLTLSDSGIASKSPVGEGNYRWEAISSMALTPDHLFIFLAGPQGFAIPRAQVPDATIQELKDFAESHINKETASSWSEIKS